MEGEIRIAYTGSWEEVGVDLVYTADFNGRILFNRVEIGMLEISKV